MSKYTPRPETLAKVFPHMPCTTRQLAERMGMRRSWVGRLMTVLVKQRYVKQEGDAVDEAGYIVPMYVRTNKVMNKP